MRIISKFIIKRIRFVFFGSLLLWTIGIFTPCFKINSPLFNLITVQFYSTVCHQNPDKSFLCSKSHLLVCNRCLGIYLGALIISLVLLFYKKKFRLNLFPLIFACTPMLIDVLAVSLNIYEYSFITALLTGILFGSVSFLYILSVIENSFSENTNR